MDPTLTPEEMLLQSHKDMKGTIHFYEIQFSKTAEYLKGLAKTIVNQTIALDHMEEVLTKLGVNYVKFNQN